MVNTGVTPKIPKGGSGFALERFIPVLVMDVPSSRRLGAMRAHFVQSVPVAAALPPREVYIVATKARLHSHPRFTTLPLPDLW